MSSDPDGSVPTPDPKLTFNVRFPGQYFDAESGLHYNRHRYYSPELGRYVSADPIGQDGGANVYTYASNDPVDLTDPSGLNPCGCPSQGSGSSFGAAFSSYYQFNKNATRGVLYGVPYKAAKGLIGFAVAQNVAQTYGFASAVQAAKAVLGGTATTGGQYGPRVVLPGLSPVAGFASRAAVVGSAAALFAAKTAIVVGTFDLGILAGSAADALIQAALAQTAAANCPPTSPAGSPSSSPSGGGSSPVVGLGGPQ